MATILVVDDDSVILDLLTAVLEEESDHTVIAATNGQEALDKLDGTTVDAVVCDVNMPVMDGIELARELRADPEMRDVPIIMISAVARAEELASDVDVDLMLEKPFEVNALLACVSFVLRGVRSGRNSIRVTRRMASSSVDRIMREHRRTTGYGSPAG